jgi:hypothetical protein
VHPDIRRACSATATGTLRRRGAFRCLRRARVIRLTSRGRRLEETIYAEAGAAQLRIAEILGPRRFAQLHNSLELLTEVLS